MIDLNLEHLPIELIDEANGVILEFDSLEDLDAYDEAEDLGAPHPEPAFRPLDAATQAQAGELALHYLIAA